MAERRIPCSAKARKCAITFIVIDGGVSILQKVIEQRSTGTLNMATGSSRSFRAIAERIATACNAVVAPSMRNNPITHRHFDVTALLTAFPDIRFTAFEQGLDRTLAAALEAAHA